MKKSILSLLLLIGCASMSSAQEITFTEVSHDFGEFDERDGSVSHDFHFTNTGDQPLLIKQVITGCGCTSAKWSDKPYAPGEKGVVRITYTPEGRKMESFSIPTEVFTNLPNPATLTVTGRVILTKHPYVNYFDPTKGNRKEYKAVEPKDDYELVLERVRQQIYASQPVEKMDKGATSLMKMLTPEGTWPQIDYKCFFRTNWEPVTHLNYVRQLATAYTCPESSLYGNFMLFRAIDKALRTWNKYQPRSYNWWYNEISAPKIMADILALLAVGVEKPDPAVLKGLMLMMEQSDPRKWTGANKQDIAMHHIVRGCVLKNDSIVSFNVGEFFEPIRITDFEGIREDLSYQQHRKQLYVGGYGTVFVDNIAKMAPLFVGTRFALTPQQAKLFSDFVRTTYLNIFRGHYMDFSVCGRSVSRKKTLNLGDYSSLFSKMKAIDPEHAQEYDEAAQRFATENPTIGRTDRNRMYWTSDYMLHNRKRYDISVRAVSENTCRSESGNGENLWGTYLSEGAYNIRVKGDEYADIFAVWEWDKIPGTTTPEGEVENHNDWGVYGVSKFVAGASDGLYGAMGYAMNDYGMKAQKGWFLFDNEMVCLGAGIEAPETDKAIYTSVNQCHLSGDVYLLPTEGDAARLQPSSTLNQSYKGWIWHNRVGYYFPESTAIQLKNGEQQGTWSKINFNQSGDLVSLPVFNLSIPHGAKPQQASYAYIVVPGIASPVSLKSYNPATIEIVSNTPQLQAVHHKQLDMLQAIFYAPGEVTVAGKTLKADRPCVMLAKKLSTEQPEVITKGVGEE